MSNEVSEHSTKIPDSFRRSPWILRRWPVVFSLLFILLSVFFAITCSVLPIQDPLLQNENNFLQSPSQENFFGTDILGRDLFARIIYGCRYSLMVGIIAVTFAMVIGFPLGVIAGYAGGRIDRIVSSMIEVMMTFPSILLAMLVIAVLGASLFNVMIAVGISQIPHYARQARGSTLAIREQEFIQAAKALGARTFRILLYHVTPNVIAPIIVVATMGLGSAILNAAGLSFLGLAGDLSQTPEWGSMLTENRERFDSQPWLVLAPGLAITASVLSFNLLGDWLRDVLDPKLRK